VSPLVVPGMPEATLFLVCLVYKIKKKITDIRIARALNPHSVSLTRLRLLYSHSPQTPLPTNPCGKVSWSWGGGASDTTFLRARARARRCEHALHAVRESHTHACARPHHAHSTTACTRVHGARTHTARSSPWHRQGLGRMQRVRRRAPAPHSYDAHTQGYHTHSQPQPPQTQDYRPTSQSVICVWHCVLCGACAWRP